MALIRAFNRLESRLRARYNVAPVDAESWRRARIYNTWFDHALLRHVWTNQAEIAPGVLRSNHPTEGRLRRLAAGGLRSVLTLRGTGDGAHNLTERAWCDELGLTLHAIGLPDKSAPSAESLLALVAQFRRIEKPFLMHCKAGADRAGLASAIYLMTIEGRPLAEAREMLSFRFYHLRRSRAGVLDEVLDAYAAAGAEAALPFETWLRTGYDPAAATAAHRARRG